MMMIIKAWSLMYILQMHEAFKLTEIPTKGIVFEEVGTTWFYRNKWTVWTTLNKPNNSVAMKFMKYAEYEITLLCNTKTTSKARNCNNFKQEIEVISRRIRKINQEIDYFFGNNNIRNKRGAIDGIGSISKYLFGTMDQEDSNVIYNKIKTLEDENVKNINFLEHASTIIENNVNWTRDQVDKLETNLKTLQENVERVFNSEINEINRMEHQIMVDELMVFTLINLMEWEHAQNEILSILGYLSNKKVHPLLLQWEQIRDQVTKAIENDNYSNFTLQPLIIQQVANVNFMPVKDGILIKISIPLIDNTEYTSYKSYIIPVITENRVASVYDSTEKIISVSAENSIYILQDNNEFKSCEIISFNIEQKTRICSTVTPTFRNPEQHCLTSLLMVNRDGTEPRCNHKIIENPKNRIIQMANANNWLLITITSLSLSTNNDTEKPTTINNTSILKLDRYQEVFIDGIKIPYIQELGNSRMIKTTADFPNFTYETYEDIRLQKLNKIKISPIESEYSGNAIEIKEFKSKLEKEKLDRMAEHKTIILEKHNTIQYSLIGTIVLLILLYTLHKWFKSKKLVRKNDKKIKTEVQSSKIEMNIIEVPKRDEKIKTEIRSSKIEIQKNEVPDINKFYEPL